MTLSGVDGATFIDPYSKDLNYYMVFNKSNLTTTKTFKCEVAEAGIDLADTTPIQNALNRASNSLYKTYRLALACTIEYAAFHVNAAGVGSGTLAQKKALESIVDEHLKEALIDFWDRCFTLTSQGKR